MESQTRHEIVTGFYTDSRHYYRVTPKVFLIINSGKYGGPHFAFYLLFSHFFNWNLILGAQSDSCVVIRPNLGRKTEWKDSIRKKLTAGSLAAVSVEQAMQIWNREFDLADKSADESYQFLCPDHRTSCTPWQHLPSHSK